MTRLSDRIECKRDEQGNPYLAVSVRGLPLLRMAAINKGTAFTDEERVALGLDGLLPPRVRTLVQQVERLYQGYQRQPSDIEKYQFLRAAQERSAISFFALLVAHLEEMMPVVYTPTVGQAVQQYSALYHTPRGLTLSPDNIERADAVVDNYPIHDVRMIVATDSSAILGIGDQGHGGLAICIGKLALYTAGGGVNPLQTLPVNLDVGTNRTELLEDPAYLGVHQRRLQGEEYFTFMDRFVDSAQQRWPNAVIQWEDFSKDVAFAVLDRYRDRVPCFNDDIQGTGAVVLAGLLAACHQKGESLADQRVVVVGAGAGGVGVAMAIQEGMVREGLDREQARRQMFVMDGKGLVVEGITRDDYKLPVSQFADTYSSWAVEGEVPSLMEVVDQAEPTVLIGLSGVPCLFNQPIVEHMVRHCERPIIFPLSNPTANAEALPEDLIKWTDGKVIVATGSPFEDVEHGGETFSIGQGNNAFIFPGLGFATVLGKCGFISDQMVLESAYALAEYTEEYHSDYGRVYPPISELQEVSIRVAARVLEVALDEGIATNRTSMDVDDMEAYVRSRFWHPEYLPVKYEPGDA
ncbi:MAG: NAD-dependent malic enzyme [bacterium]